MPTPETLAALASISRQSIRFYVDPTQIGTIAQNHRNAINNLRLQGRQSVAVIVDDLDEEAPPTPTGVTASTLSSTSTRLVWVDVTGETGYRVYRNTVNNSLTAEMISTVGSNVTAFTDIGRSPSTTYYYWVKSFNAVGESEFSVVTSTATSAPPSGNPDGPLGNYLGHFRFDRNGLDQKLFDRDMNIMPHSDPTKFYYGVSGADLAEFATVEKVYGTYLTVMDLPDFGDLDPSHTTNESPQVVAPSASAWSHDLSAEFRANVVYANGLPMTTYNGTNGFGNHNPQMGGCAYLPGTNELWVNMTRNFYKGNSGTVMPCIAKYDPVTFEKLTDWQVPTGGQRLNENSGYAGKITSTAGTALAAYGEFIVTPSWISNTGGPRLGILQLNTPAEGQVSMIEFILYDDVGNPNSLEAQRDGITIDNSGAHPLASMRTKHGTCVFVGDNLVLAVQNGTAGWYGGQDGVSRGLPEDSFFVAQDTNWTPDVHIGGKGYKAHPYKAQTWSIPIAQIVEALEQNRALNDYDLEVHEHSGRLKRFISQEFFTGDGTYDYVTDTISGLTSIGTQNSYRAETDSHLVKINGYILWPEHRGRLDGNFQQHIVHVWSGDN